MARLTPLPLETSRAMLAHLSPDMPRDEWAAVAMALKSELGEAGAALFDEFSQRSEKYRAGDVRSTWRSVKAGGRVTIGTLVHMAKAAGWKGDDAQASAQPPSAAELQAAAAVRREAAETERQQQAATQRERAARARELWEQASDNGEAAYPLRKGLQGLHGARVAPGGTLRVPMRDAAGELWNCQDILAEKLRDKFTGEPTTDKLYAAGRGGRKAGLFHLIGCADGAEVLLIGEGFATCASVHEATGRPAAVAFDAGNLAAVSRELHRLHPAALVVVLADNDRATETSTGHNPGREGAAKAARAVGGAVASPEPADLPAEGTDWNDAAAHLGREHVAGCIEAVIAEARTQRQRKAQTAPQRPANSATRPSPADANDGPPEPPDSPPLTGPDDEREQPDEHDAFMLDERGVWFHGFDHQGRPRSPLLVCGPLRVTARTRLRNGAGWGYLLEFNDPDKTPKEWVIGAAELQGEGKEFRGTLAGLGFHIGETRGAREKLAQYIQSRRVRTFARLVERTGWCDDEEGIYAMPGRVFGKPRERIYLSPELTNDHKFRQGGSALRWRKSIGRICEGNSLPTFCVSAAFAGPLLKLAGQKSGGIHVCGPSSKGKSSSLCCAVSVWGPPSFGSLWRNSDNAVEYLAQSRSDSLLVLDELVQCDARVVRDTIYMIGNQAGKGRAKAGGGLRPTPEWRVFVLSAGELTPEQHMAKAGVQSLEGQRVRLPSIPAIPEGCTDTVFETNHEFKNAKELSQFIVDQAELNYGHAGVVFLERLTKDVAGVRERLREGMAAFRHAHLPERADPQVGRILDRFALVAIAGELATEYGITGWPKGWATRAAVACFHGMVKIRPGGFGSGEQAARLRQVRTFFAEKGQSNFDTWDRADKSDDRRAKTPFMVGFVKEIPDPVDPTTVTACEWYCHPDVFAKQVCEGLDAEEVLRLLRDRGHLVANPKRLTYETRLPGLGKRRYHLIKSSILDDFGED